MGIYHETTPFTGYYLYTNGSQIFLRNQSGDMIGRPIILAKDYQMDFTSIPYNNSIYFAYLNDKNQLILRSTKENGILYHLDAKPDMYFTSLHLEVFQQKLLLFYGEKKEDTYYIKYVCPFEDTDAITLEQTFRLCPKIQCISANTNLILSLSNDNISVSYLIQETLEPLILGCAKDFQHLENPDQQKKLKALNLKYASELSNLHQAIQTLQSKIQLQETTIQKQNAMIESATQQYNELMNVATRYREEAIKWRSKLSKET